MHSNRVKLGVDWYSQSQTPVKLLAIYLLLELGEVFFANMQDILAATLPDIESDIMYMHYFSKKKTECLIKSAVRVYSEFCALN